MVMILISPSFLNVNGVFARSDANTRKSAIDFLENFYELRANAIVNDSKIPEFIKCYSKQSKLLKSHEISRVYFYRNWITTFNGQFVRVDSHINVIGNNFKFIDNKAYLKVYEWMVVKWKEGTKKRNSVLVTDLKNLKSLEKRTGNKFLKENLSFGIKELEREINNPPVNIVSGMGVVHSVVLVKDKNSWKILKDSYDEGPDLTKFPDFKSDSHDLAATENSKLFELPVKSSLKNIGEYYPQAEYNANETLDYADECVDHSAEGGIYSDYYNLNYVDFNPPHVDSFVEKEKLNGVNYKGGGGDCANYVSQCIFAGGERMIKNEWYYDNNGTGLSGPVYNPDLNGLYWMKDDKSSASWTSVRYLINFITNYNRGYPSENPEDAISRDIVYQKNYGHVMIVYRNTGNGILVNGHNNDRYHWPYSYGIYYNVIWMYHSYPLIENGNDHLFYPANFPVVRIVDGGN